jgi:site-specific DNA recombinase
VNDGGEELAAGAELLENALLLLANPQELYRRMSPEQRRLLNQAIFERLYVSEDERVAITGAQLNTPFGDLIDARDELGLIRHRRQANRTASSAALAKAVGEAQSPLTSLFVGHGSKRPVMVEVTGLEPATSTMRT